MCFKHLFKCRNVFCTSKSIHLISNIFFYIVLTVLIQFVERKRRWVDRETGTVGHASIWTSRGGICASVAANRRAAAVSEEVGLVSGTEDRMWGPGTGTVALEIVELTILQADQAASNVELSKTTCRPLTSIFLVVVLEGFPHLLFPVPPVLLPPLGSPVTGFVQGKSRNISLIIIWLFLRFFTMIFILLFDQN